MSLVVYSHEPAFRMSVALIHTVVTKTIALGKHSVAGQQSSFPEGA